MVNHSDFLIGGIRLSLFSKVPLKSLDYSQYQPYLKKKDIADFSLSFHFISFSDLNNTQIRYSNTEKSVLKNSIGFSPEWLNNPFIAHPQIVSVLKKCLTHIDHCQIEFLFERILIRDYLQKEIHYFYPSSRSLSFSDDSFHAIFRNTFTPFLPMFSAALIHGSAVSFPDGRAAAFFASDGGGKTTLVSQFSNESILNDDQLLIKKENTDLFVHSTPFGRLGNTIQKGRLCGLFLLEKGEIFSITSVKSHTLFEFIWKEHQRVWHILPNYYRESAFQLISEICYSAPTYRLVFPKNYVDWNDVKKSLKP